MNDDFACHKTRFVYAGIFNTERAFTFDGVMKYDGEQALPLSSDTGRIVTVEKPSLRQNGWHIRGRRLPHCFVHDERLTKVSV
ncbi:MAG: hypothetical protein CM15mP74_33050 [Halieaceae bacterium]|nr:MAG: hypothetical protein CM15mP74_33050 [Halieaceae bacterium]